MHANRYSRCCLLFVGLFAKSTLELRNNHGFLDIMVALSRRASLCIAGQTREAVPTTSSSNVTCRDNLHSFPRESNFTTCRIVSCLSVCNNDGKFGAHHTALAYQRLCLRSRIQSAMQSLDGGESHLRPAFD